MRFSLHGLFSVFAILAACSAPAESAPPVSSEMKGETIEGAQRVAPGGCVISLIKPHYEADKRWLRRGVLPPERLEETLALTREDVTDLGWRIVDECASPLLGHSGNTEMLWLLRR